jgi:hypothetical protein
MPNPPLKLEKAKCFVFWFDDITQQKYIILKGEEQ